MKNEELANFIIQSDQTIRQAMEKINNNWREIVFVQDAQGCIIGTITDGDIRRGLLLGFTLEDEIRHIVKEHYIYVGVDADRATVLDIMKARSVRQIPIIDNEKKLIGIHFLQDLIGAEVKPNIAVIMAGGKGTRLRPLTNACPKPMILVAGRPILERIIFQLMSFGITQIYISVNYLSSVIENYFLDGSKFGCSITYLKEDQPLGTGGALSLLPKKPKEPILVLNGDLLTQVNIAQLLCFHENNHFEATICAKSYQVEVPFGVIETEGNKVIQIEEKPQLNMLINAGIYVLNPEILNLIPDNEEYQMTTLIDTLVNNKRPIGTYVLEEEWADVGRLEDLRRACGEC